MLAGTGKIDITPQNNIWMDGMLRAHPSEGVHDALYARALVLCEGSDVKQAFALVSVDVCVLDERPDVAVRQGARLVRAFQPPISSSRPRTPIRGRRPWDLHTP